MKLYFLTGALILFFVEIYSLIPLRQSHPLPGELTSTRFLSGIIHVHSQFSDGFATIPEIAEAANLSGNDFVVVADLGTSKGRTEYAKSFGKTDVFVEMEVPTPAGHLLFFYSHTKSRDLSDDKIIPLAWEQFQNPAKSEYPETFAVTAHPSSSNIPWNVLDRFPQGTEVISLGSMFRRSMETDLLGTALTLFTYPLNNYLAALREIDVPRKDLASFDAMNAASPGHFGIIGENVHEQLRKLRWPRYEQMFRLASNIVFLSTVPEVDFENRKRQIYTALRRGKSAMIFSFIHPFVGNDWFARCGQQTYRSGDKLPHSAECDFCARTPADFPYRRILRLWKDGELVKEKLNATPEDTLPITGPGSYRLEVWAAPHSLFRLALDREIPYLFYNPIMVR